MIHATAIVEDGAEVGESTLRLWLREDENFQAKLRQVREETLSHTTTRLQQEAERALDSVSSLLASRRRIEPGRRAPEQTAERCDPLQPPSPKVPIMRDSLRSRAHQISEPSSAKSKSPSAGRAAVRAGTLAASAPR